MPEDDRSQLRTKLIRRAIAAQIKEGLDYDSFLVGLHLALADPTLGGWIIAAFDINDDSAARLRHLHEQATATIREMLDESGVGDEEPP